MNMDLTDEELLRSFEQATLPASAFPHRVHVHMAWLYLGRDPLPIALEKFITDLKKFAAANGAADKYHATITFAFMVLINERMERGSREASFEEFARANPDFFEKDYLLRYYAAETLASPIAKKTFVLPARAVVSNNSAAAT
jgi:hypothetical protein